MAFLGCFNSTSVSASCPGVSSYTAVQVCSWQWNSIHCGKAKCLDLSVVESKICRSYLSLIFSLLHVYTW